MSRRPPEVGPKMCQKRARCTFGIGQTARTGFRHPKGHEAAEETGSMDTDAAAMVYRFGGFTLDLSRGSLLAADGAEIALRPKAFALLRHLVQHPGRLVDRDELMRAVWPGVFVTEDSVTQIGRASCRERV